MSTNDRDSYEAAKVLYRDKWSLQEIDQVLRNPVWNLKERLHNEHLLRSDNPHHNGIFGLHEHTVLRQMPLFLLRDKAIEVLKSQGWLEPRIKTVLIDNPLPDISRLSQFNPPNPNIEDIFSGLTQSQGSESQQDQVLLKRWRSEAAGILRERGWQEGKISAVLRDL